MIIFTESEWQDSITSYNFLTLQVIRRNGSSSPAARWDSKFWNAGILNNVILIGLHWLFVIFNKWFAIFTDTNTTQQILPLGRPLGVILVHSLMTNIIHNNRSRIVCFLRHCNDFAQTLLVRSSPFTQRARLKLSNILQCVFLGKY